MGLQVVERHDLVCSSIWCPTLAHHIESVGRQVGDPIHPQLIHMWSQPPFHLLFIISLAVMLCAFSFVVPPRLDMGAFRMPTSFSVYLFESMLHHPPYVVVVWSQEQRWEAHLLISASSTCMLEFNIVFLEINKYPIFVRFLAKFYANSLPFSDSPH